MVNFVSTDKKVIRKQIEEKYFLHDLSSISTEKLIENERMTKSIGGRIAYPFKEKHNAFATNGIYAKWHNDSEHITVDISGALGDKCVNIFDENHEKSKADIKSDFTTASDKTINPRYQLKNHENFKSWIDFIVD